MSFVLPLSQELAARLTPCAYCAGDLMSLATCRVLELDADWLVRRGWRG